VENSIVIWDQQELPKGISDEVLLWQSYVNRDNFLSVPGYLEQNAEQFKIKYLKFIHELGESKLRGKRIVDHFDVGDGFSIWWMTLLAEKSPFKSPAIYDCLRLMALEEILKEKNLSDVKLFSDDNNLGLALQNLCTKIQIQFLWEAPNQKGTQRWSIKRIFHVLPLEFQAIVSLLKHITLRWRLKKLDTPEWHTGYSVFFFALISFTLIPSPVIRGVFIQGSGSHCRN